ncbi:CaiB/BaiF CoA transferase family protein [Pseudohalioglobus lutimaris]|uniref:CoA transferase n=1 Tax=Pseudohalioglobus lutimaris TaxID=1737061 RepID=A0A2N5X3W0_9GAMM|nr:CoA transferase [Pseudohalioglobus lutimaris]PLW69163.1 CoA transferase [Pseudohalioglobus lutimaris]
MSDMTGNDTDFSNGPLSGLRVLDCSTMLAAPYGATLLGDMGADVIKIESHHGDDSRKFGPMRGEDAGPFLSLNRNKRDMVLDLRQQEAQRVFADVASTADVLITNVREPALSKLGISYEQVKAHKPDIIWIRVTAFGPDGPYDGRPGIDFLVQGYAGVLALNGEPDGEPVRTSFPAVDVMTSMMVANAAQAALRVRDRTGEGQRIEVSLLDTLVHAQASSIGTYLTTGEIPERTGNRSLAFAPSGCFPTRDRHHVVITTPGEKFFANICRALATDWDSDTRFANAAARKANEDELDRLISERTCQFDRQDLVEKLVAADVLVAPINTPAEVPLDPQIRHNNMLVDVVHPEYGEVTVTGIPIRFYGTPCEVRQHPPLLGEHTRELLAEAGYGAGDIDELIRKGLAADNADIKRRRKQRRG